MAEYTQSRAQQSIWVFKPCKQVPYFIWNIPPLANYWVSMWFTYCNTTHTMGHKEYILQFQNTGWDVDTLVQARTENDGLQADQTWACVPCPIDHESCLVVRWQLMGQCTSGVVLFPESNLSWARPCCLGAQQGLFFVSQRHWLLSSAASDVGVFEFQYGWWWWAYYRM